MPDYTYIFGSMRDEKTLQEISCYGTYCENQMNVGGRFDCSFQLDQTGKRNEDLIAATTPGESWAVVVRDGEPIWGGTVWSRVYQSQSKNVQLYSQSWEQYPNRQLIEQNISVTGEQRVLFNNLWSTMMGYNGRNVNIILPDNASFPTVVSKTVTVLRSDMKYFGEIMSELADATDGFDWTIDIVRDGPYFRKDLRIGYPTLGSVAPSLFYDYPGQILNYYATESMSVAGTNIFTVGAGQGSSMLIDAREQTLQINQGFPRWDYVISRKDITTQANLSTVGAQEFVKRKPPMMTVKASFKGGIKGPIEAANPDFGDFGMGDTVRLYIKDARFPAGVTVTGRVIKWTLNPGSAENADEYTILFETDDI